MSWSPETIFACWFVGLIIGASLSTVWEASNAMIIILLCGGAGVVSGIVIEIMR